MTIIEEMYERSAERTDKCVPSVVTLFPSLYQLKETTLIGSFSWTGLTSHRRLINYPTSIRFFDQIITPGDAARDYLSIKYPKKLRCTTSQYREFKTHRQAPLYSQPCTIPDADYVDLKSAFWSILKIIGWDVEYMPGQYLMSRSDVSDFPFPDNKLARNCLVTSGIVSHNRMWLYKTQELKICTRGNTMANNVLYSCIMDVLNCIALDAIAAGARYVHTDGYICASRDTPRLMTALAQWGLSSTIKRSGAATINAVGSYSVGPYSTRTRVQTAKQTNAVQSLVNRDWLRDRIRRLSGL